MLESLEYFSLSDRLGDLHFNNCCRLVAVNQNKNKHVRNCLTVFPVGCANFSFSLICMYAIS